MKFNKYFTTAAFSFAAAAAMAANPFIDVPANHWAYDAISSLNEKGIVIGYPGDTFKGDKPVTRYHLAMIVSRMLAKLDQGEIGGAQSVLTRKDLKTLEKLTVEFADELALLGVKTSALEEDMNYVKADLGKVKSDVEHIKSNMESGAFDKVRITGDAIIRHEDQIKGGNAGILGQVTTAALRLQFNVKVDEKIDAVVQSMIYADDLGTNLGGAAGNAMTYYRTAGRNRQNDIYNAHISIKDVLDGKLVLGRSFYTHGSQLVMNGYVDAIRYNRKIGKSNVALNMIYRDVTLNYDGTNAPNARRDRQIWNVNFDRDFNGHKVYAGYYTQDYLYDTDSTRSIFELGSKGKITNDNKFTYDLGLVFTEIDDFMGGEDMDGNLAYLAVKYSDGKDWKFKLAYAAGDDEYISANVFTLRGGKWLYGRNDMKTFDGPETPFDDICYMRPAMSMQNADLGKVQVEYQPKDSKHYVRVAYEVYNQDEKAAKGIAADDEAKLLTLEYKYQLARNTKLRVAYYSLDGDKASDGIEDDAMFVEIYSRF